MTAASDGNRSVYVVAADDTVRRALSEHRSGPAGWNVAMLSVTRDFPPEPDAIVVVDLDDPAVQSGSVEVVRTSGFAGPILILGNNGPARVPEDEPIARPVRLGTLLARIDAHWTVATDPGTIALGPYEFVSADRVLRDAANDVVIRLTELEHKLLSYLAAAGGGLIDRDQLLECVWGYNTQADTHTVETHIWRLRQKIETDDPASRFLVTEAGGYRLLLAGSDSGG